MTPLSFATLDHRNKKKQTKHERFLGDMDAIVPWATLVGLIEPHYPKAGKKLLRDLALELGAVGSVFGHGLSP